LVLWKKKEKKKTLQRTKSSGSLEIQANETNTIEIRHNKYPFLEEGNQVYFLFLPFQFGCWGRWNQQVERIGWEIWMMIYDDSFHNDQNPRSYLIFSILHNQTPNIQDSNSSFKFAMKFSHAKKYGQVLLFYQLHNSRSSIHSSIHSSTHPSIHLQPFFTCHKHWVLDLVSSHSYYLKAWVWWYLQ
jgi:hypothetical protein